ncbi:hypothetical protein GJAV_G00237620 [Gymnothorax javanicus]|nr:hypothetical protein GJAV_G00237620 [Gymnothorax javanicus]
MSALSGDGERLHPALHCGSTQWGGPSAPAQRLRGMPGDYLRHAGPMAMTVAQPRYSPAPLRHGPPLPAYIPGHAPHPAVLMPGGPAHPAMPLSASSPALLTPGDPSMGGQAVDIHAQ